LGAPDKMSDIGELEQRISGALDRIGAGLSGLEVPVSSGADSSEMKALQELLAAERTANAQLEERVAAIKQKQETLVQSLETEAARLREELVAATDERARMKQVNRRLRRNNRALRDANEQGLGDAGLINDSMVAELDALRVHHDADRAELDSILVELKPLVQGVADA